MKSGKRRFKILFLLFFSLQFLVFACKKSDDKSAEINVTEENPNCNVFASGDCFSPFPSNFYLKNGRVSIDPSVLPATRDGVEFPREAFYIFDGFSPLSQIIYKFSSPIRRDLLPGLNEEEYSMDSRSPVQLIDPESRSRVPILAETDYRSDPEKVLIIRPLIRLRPGRTYLVVLKKDLTDGDPPEKFRILRDGMVTDDEYLNSLKERFEGYFTTVEEMGVSREDIFLMWDFTTGSDENIIKKNLCKIKNYIYNFSPDRVEYEVKDVSLYPDDDGYIYKYIKGEFSVPLFLDSGLNVLKRDTDGSVKTTNVPISDANFYVNIPTCITEGTTNIPVVVIGHGFASSAGATLRKTYFRRFAYEFCSIQVAVKWYGASWVELIGLFSTIFDRDVYPIYAFIYTVNKLMQAHANFLLLSRLLKKKEFYDAIGIDFDKVDTSSVFYFGYSNGGIQGGTFAALTDDIKRFVLNVTGGVWSLIFQRYHNWEDFERPLRGKFDDPVVVTELLFLSQMFFDFIDPVTFAPYLLKDPGYLGIAQDKQILLQESYGDPSVTNISTRILARTMRLKGLRKFVEQVYGLSEYPEPLSSAYTQWNSKPDILPPVENTPLTVEQHTEVNEDLSAHSAIKWINNLKRQVYEFYDTGLIRQFCSDDLCDPE